MSMLRPVALVALVITGPWLSFPVPISAQEKTVDATSALAGRNDDAEEAANLPKAVIAIQQRDVGEIRRGQPVSCEFVIENRGKSPLEITTKPNCGCTIVEHDKVIAPGEQGKIKAAVRTSSLRGNFQKSVTVQTNDPARQSFQLVLSGRIVETVELVPHHVPSMNLKLEGPTEHQLVLRTLKHVEVTGVTCEDRYVQAGIEPLGEQNYRVRITVGADAPLGRSSFVLMVATTAEHERALPIMVSCEKGIIAFPSSFVFAGGRSDSIASPTSRVLLRKRVGKIHVRTATSNNPEIEANVAELKEGILYRVTATYHGDIARLDGSATVMVETDDPEQPRLEIPVKGLQRSTASRAIGD